MRPFRRTTLSPLEGSALMEAPTFMEYTSIERQIYTENPIYIQVLNFILGFGYAPFQQNKAIYTDES